MMPMAMAFLDAAAVILVNDGRESPDLLGRGVEGLLESRNGGAEMKPKDSSTA